ITIFFLSVKSSDIVDLQVQTVRLGDNTTIKCDQKEAKDNLLYWYQQSLGKLPQYIVRPFVTEVNSPQESPQVRYRFGRAFENSRFTVDKETFDLSINGVEKEDIGIYFCGNSKSAVLEFLSGTLLLFAGNCEHIYCYCCFVLIIDVSFISLYLLHLLIYFKDEKTDHHPPPDPAIKNEEAVKLQCSVQAVTLSCSGDHSVSWIRHGSGESHPGIIYIHPHTSDECKKSSETDSPPQSCVYKLPKRKLSLSDAGTYYCAVAECGDEAESTGKGDVFTVWCFIVKVVVLACLFVTQTVLHIFIKFSQK
uniref:Ig-like domain-containing protein n=1 Tax=Pygocentrus nattereri TaxID=42514 RepID=A0AAR2KG17_PYGNA